MVPFFEKEVFKNFKDLNNDFLIEIVKTASEIHFWYSRTNSAFTKGQTKSK